MSEILLEARKIRKSFGALLATDDVDFDVRAGETHAVIGPNGAGKTTFIKQLSGGDVPLRRDGLALRYIRNLIPRAPGSNADREFPRHADTRHVVYDIDPGLGIGPAMLNREIQRVVPRPGARSYDANPVFAELTGKIRAPVMSGGSECSPLRAHASVS